MHIRMLAYTRTQAHVCGCERIHLHTYTYSSTCILTHTHTRALTHIPPLLTNTHTYTPGHALEQRNVVWVGGTEHSQVSIPVWIQVNMRGFFPSSVETNWRKV